MRYLGGTFGLLGGGCLALSTACGSSPGKAVTVPLAELPLGARVRVLDGEHPVELVRTETGVTSRSLWCTHTGCEVRWVDAAGEYVCPCHEGRFAANGEVVAGPPPRPLPTYPIRVTDTEVVLGDSTGA